MVINHYLTDTMANLVITIDGPAASGKSTIAALLANKAQVMGYRVLVVDSDESNSGLFRMLGFDHPPAPLMELVGGKKGLKQRMAQANVLSETHITTAQIPQQHLMQRNGLKLVAIGKILQSLEGCACPMGVLSREFLKKLTLENDEMVIVDTEAGVEHFGRGVDTSIDSVLVVVEPPLESVSVGHKIYELASSIGIKNVWAVLNKVPSAVIATRLQKELQKLGIEVVGCIYFDNEIFTSSIYGKIPTNGVAVRETKHVVDNILSQSEIPKCI